MDGKLKLLRLMVDEHIRREGEASSFGLRAGLLRDILEKLQPTETEKAA